MPDQKEQNQEQAQASDYLSKPEKKEKEYIVVAVNKHFDHSTITQVEDFIRKGYSHYTIIKPKAAKDIVKLINRKIILLILDDEFIPDGKVVKTVKKLKTKKGDTALPVLFLTKSPEQLIENYNEDLLLYQEIDTYADYTKLGDPQMRQVIKGILQGTNRRKSRRHPIQQAMFYTILERPNKLIPGEIQDMSLHGATIYSESSIFKKDNQLVITIQLNRQSSIEHGEFLKVSAKVRYVYMSGSKAAISWEHVTERQMYALTEFLTEKVRLQMAT